MIGRQTCPTLLGLEGLPPRDTRQIAAAVAPTASAATNGEDLPATTER